MLYNSVCWSPDLSLFCAITTTTGTGGVLTSSNGTTWVTQIAVGTGTVSWSDVCWSSELGIFVAVRNVAGISVMYSTNGTTWITSTSPAVANNWNAICWSPQLMQFCVVANTASTTSVMTSNTGTQWVTSTTPSMPLIDVCWSGTATANSTSNVGCYCAISTIQATSSIMTSFDGLVWTTRASATTAFTNEAVTWSPELSLFCIVGNTATGSSQAIQTSSDGNTWTTRTPSTIGTWLAVAWSPQLSLFCAAGTNIMTSPDGLIWTSRAGPSKTVDRLTWAPSLNIFLGVCTSATANATNIITNIYPTTSFNNSLVLGTGSSSNVTIDGSVVSIGKRSNTLRLGDYADQIYISGVNFNTIRNQVCFAAASFLQTATGAIIYYSFNVSSIVFVATGNSIINFSKPAPRIDYYAIATGDNQNTASGTANQLIGIYFTSITQFGVISKASNNGTSKNTTIFVAAFLPATNTNVT